MKTILLFLFAGIFITLTAGAQQAAVHPPDTLRMSVQQARAYALEHKTDVKNKRLDAESAKRQSQAYMGQGLPQLEGTIDFNDYLTLPTSLIPAEFFGGEPGTFIPVKFGTQYNMNIGATASQLIFDGRYFLGLRAAKAL